MKYQWSETFLSIEGEAKWSGHPTVYVRFTNCNFECRGFNNPDDKDPSSQEVLGFNPADLISVTDIPSIEVGCDSIYAWHKDFRHMWSEGDEEKLANELTGLLPSTFNEEWIHPKTNVQAILSLTGGEPTLRQKTIPALINRPEFDSLKHILIETNCSVPLKPEFITALSIWASHRGGTVTWSNSPKLMASGEPREKAVRPDIAMQQRSMSLDTYDQYFKFVCDNDDAHFDEVEDVMEEYYKGGVPRNVPIYIMPMACTETQQKEIMMGVADKCIERGMIYCHRVHNTVYENAIGK